MEILCCWIPDYKRPEKVSTLQRKDCPSSRKLQFVQRSLVWEKCQWTVLEKSGRLLQGIKIPYMITYVLIKTATNLDNYLFWWFLKSDGTKRTEGRRENPWVNPQICNYFFVLHRRAYAPKKPKLFNGNILFAVVKLKFRKDCRLPYIHQRGYFNEF